MKNYYIFIFLIFAQVGLQAQWFSGEVELSSLRNIAQNEYTSYENETIRSVIEGMDTSYVLQSSSYTVLAQNTQVNIFGPRAAIRYNVPLNEKFIVSAGIGLSVHTFRTDVEYDVLDYEITASETLENYVPESTGLPNFTPCDTFNRYADFDIQEGTANTILVAHIPIGLEYAIFEDNLNIQANCSFGFPIANYQSRDGFITRTDEELTTEDMRVCNRLWNPERISDNSYLSDFSMEASLGIRFKIFKNFWANASFAQTLIPLDRVGVTHPDRDFVIPEKYRPHYFRVGLSMDLVLPKNLEKRRKNYLLNRNLSDEF